MKKLLFKAIPVLGIAFLFSTSARAQVTSEIRDFYNGNLVTNDTFYFWVALGDAHQYDFNQYNIGTSSVTYKVSKTNVQLMSGAQSNFCLYHNNDAGDPQSQCYIPSVTMSGTFMTAVGEFNTLLADFSAGTTTMGVSIVHYRFFDMNNTADSACITLVYNVTPVGIAESFVGGSLGEPYPDPANTSVSIPVTQNTTNAHLTITDALGQVVYEEVLPGIAERTVTISVDTWAEGVYFITLSDEHAIIARKKLMVQ